MNTKNYYNSKSGRSIYDIASDFDLNSYEFDILKRIIRARHKGNFKEDLEKTKDVIDIYLAEFKDNIPKYKIGDFINFLYYQNIFTAEIKGINEDKTYFVEFYGLNPDGETFFKSIVRVSFDASSIELSNDYCIYKFKKTERKYKKHNKI